MGRVVIQGSEFKHSLSVAEASAASVKIHAASATAKTLRKQMAALKKNSADFAHSVGEFLINPSAKLACAVEAAKRLPERKRPSLEKLLDIPSLLNVKKQLPEPDRITVKVKKSGGIRF